MHAKKQQRVFFITPNNLAIWHLAIHLASICVPNEIALGYFTEDQLIDIYQKRGNKSRSNLDNVCKQTFEVACRLCELLKHVKMISKALLSLLILFVDVSQGIYYNDTPFLDHIKSDDVYFQSYYEPWYNQTIQFLQTLQASTKISQSCRNSLNRWLTGLDEKEAWAIKFLEATGKTVMVNLQGEMLTLALSVSVRALQETKLRMSTSTANTAPCPYKRRNRK